VTKDLIEYAFLIERFWLSAQVMIACILMGLLALSIQSSRGSITYFPETFNTTCSSATYDVKNSIEYALTVMLDEAVNITNSQYQNSVNLTRGILSKSMNMSIDIFLLLLKNINPLVYCTLDSGLGMVQSTKSALKNLELSVPTLSCPISTRSVQGVEHMKGVNDAEVQDVGSERSTDSRSSSRPQRDIDICKDATDELQSLASSLSDLIGEWPEIPDSLTDALDMTLNAFNLNQYINDLGNFPAPDFIITVNSSELIHNALANSTAFDDILVTCTEVSVKFTSATYHTARVMYYIEIAIWAAICALLLGIFIVAIIRQFPTVVVDWFTRKIANYTNQWESRIDNLEKNTVRTWQLYLIWTLKYINFKKAALTTVYGIIGIVLVYNLTSITNTATRPVEIWVNTSLGPAFDKIQGKLQDAINHAIDDVEVQLNLILHDEILSTIAPANGTLNKIITEKDNVLAVFNNISAQVSSVPVIGAPIANALRCMLPIGALTMVDTAIDLMVTFLQEMMVAQLTFPRLSFPDISKIAVSTTHVVVVRSVQVIQDQLKQYQIIFIVLTCAFGILVFQGLLFVALKRIAMRIKKQRRLTRMKSQSQM